MHKIKLSALSKSLILSAVLVSSSSALADDDYKRCIEQAEKLHDQCLDSGHSNCGTTRSDQYNACRERYFYKD